MTRVEGTDNDSQLRRFQLLSVILAVAVVLALVALVLLYRAKEDADDKAADAKAQLGDLDSAESAARDLLVDMTTYDYRHLDEAYDWLDELTNSDVKKNFVDHKSDFEKVIRLSKASSKGEVQESAYRPGADGKSVVVVAFVHQVITEHVKNTQKAEDQWATLTMVPDGSGWAAQDIQLSGIPNPDGTVTQQ